ncbi:GPP34 family phosphoprotein [uncultured Modestobacter sp.]|uniref:GPP34 family phosphoprotein n=1 Tax=uncultured Modestobacter sp. TaxID=380048 RepID=UPI0026130B3B|nr:GPP34 family phosphoprotein [uncultured Modestobacter sp.]
MDPSDGVAARLAAVCVDARGRLRSFDIWDAAARGALLVDAAHCGRLAETADSISLDPAPTRFPPLDRLLSAMDADPGHPLTWWLDHGDAGMSQVAEACVGAGVWSVRRGLLGTRYGTPPAPVAAASGDVVAAAVAVFVTACGARGRWPEPVLAPELTPTGSLAWICTTVTDHLELVHRRNLRAAGAADGGSSPYY